jgi:hypothetical protein
MLRRCKRTTYLRDEWRIWATAADPEDATVSLHFLQYSCCSAAQSSLLRQDGNPAIGHLSTKYGRKHPPDAETHNWRDAMQ